MAELVHYIDDLSADPRFEAYQDELRGEFNQKLKALMELPDETQTHVLARKIGELRGVWLALDEPQRIRNRLKARE